MNKPSNGTNYDSQLQAATQFVEYFVITLELDQEQAQAFLRSPDESLHSFLDRVSYLMKSVRFATLLLSDKERGYSWFLKPNDSELLKGSTPIDFLLGGSLDNYHDLCVFLGSQF